MFNKKPTQEKNKKRKIYSQIYLNQKLNNNKNNVTRKDRFKV
jgi:hypothetical protein